MPIPDDETYGELQLRLSELGALALIEAMTLISLGEAQEVAQDESQATYAGKIERSAARIDWSRSAVEVSRLIRAYDPKPGAFTSLNGADMKVFGARVLPHTNHVPGKVVEIETEGRVGACGDGAVRVYQVQPAGKSAMAPEVRARGRGVAVGDRLG